MRTSWTKVCAECHMLVQRHTEVTAQQTASPTDGTHTCGVDAAHDQLLVGAHAGGRGAHQRCAGRGAHGRGQALGRGAQHLLRHVASGRGRRLRRAGQQAADALPGWRAVARAGGSSGGELGQGQLRHAASTGLLQDTDTQGNESVRGQGTTTNGTAGKLSRVAAWSSVIEGHRVWREGVHS